ncbi:MAG: hypothetical protein RI894_1323 [Bacteroidota bacterium]|jgi:hypothetical protein
MKLYEILETLDVYTLNRFRKYTASPFFNEKEIVLQILDALLPILKRRRRNEAINLPTKLELWALLKLNLDYNDTQIRRACSDLSQLAQEFLLFCEFEKDKISIYRYQSQALFDHNLHKHFKSTLSNEDLKITGDSTQTPDVLLSNFLLENQKDAWLVRDMRRTQQTNITAAANALDIFYLAERLRMCCDVLNYQNVLKLPLELVGNEHIIALSESCEYAEIPVIKIYYTILKTLLKPNDQTHFDGLKAALRQHIIVVKPTQQREIYTFALNYCIRKINLGEVAFYQELFELYQYVLSNNYIFDNGKLPAWDYKNIVTLGLRLKEYTWVERFLYDYNDRLPDNFKENALNYNLAKLNFSIGKFGKVIDLLQVVEYQDIFYTLDSKALLVKTYFELSEWSVIEAQLESFRVFLVREKTVSETTRQQFLNFCRFTKKIIQFPNKKKLNVLLTELEQTTEVADRQWLRSKIT